MPRPLTRLLLLAAVVFPTGAAAQTFATSKGHVEFTSHVPLHTFTGVSDHLTGEIDLAERTVDFFVDVHTIETGIGKRDRDMRQALEADEHPFAEFFGRLLTPFDSSASGPQRARVRGRFAIHGVSREMEIEGTIQREGDGLRIRAAWVVRLDDHAIEPPRLLMLKLRNDQEVAIDALLRPKEDAP